jgi:hypothetical protein
MKLWERLGAAVPWEAVWEGLGAASPMLVNRSQTIFICSRLLINVEKASVPEQQSFYICVDEVKK